MAAPRRFACVRRLLRQRGVSCDGASDDGASDDGGPEKPRGTAAGRILACAWSRWVRQERRAPGDARRAEPVPAELSGADCRMMADKLIMSDFTYRHGTLTAESVPLETIAAAVGTPFYCYSRSGIERQYRAYPAAFSGPSASISLAAQANSN